MITPITRLTRSITDRTGATNKHVEYLESEGIAQLVGIYRTGEMVSLRGKPEDLGLEEGWVASGDAPQDEVRDPWTNEQELIVWWTMPASSTVHYGCFPGPGPRSRGPCAVVRSTYPRPGRRASRRRSPASGPARQYWSSVDLDKPRQPIGLIGLSTGSRTGRARKRTFPIPAKAPGR